MKNKIQQAASLLGRLGANATNRKYKELKKEWCAKGGRAGKGVKKPHKK